MAKPGTSPGPVILFTHEGISYEYLKSLGLGPQGESLLLARKRTSGGCFMRTGPLPPGQYRGAW